VDVIGVFRFSRPRFANSVGKDERPGGILPVNRIGTFAEGLGGAGGRFVGRAQEGTAPNA